MTKLPFKYEVNSTSNTALIKVFGYIGGAVDSAYFSYMLDDLRSQGVKNLEVWVNSPGGSMWHGNHVYNELNNWEGELDITILSLAASMASKIAMAGKKKPKMFANGQFMIHDPKFTGEDIRIEEIDGIKEMMVGMRDAAAKAYALKSGNPVKKVRQWMAATTWFSAEKALKYGFISEIVDGPLPDDPDMVTKFDLKAYDYKNVPTCLATTILTPNNTMSGTTTTQGGTSQPAGQQTTNTPQPTNTAEVTALQKQLDEMKAQQLKDKAELLVENAIEQKKITTEKKSVYVSLAMADFENTKAILADMKPPVSITNQINTGNTGGSTGSGAQATEKTFEQLMKEDAKALMKLRDENPSEYGRLYKAHYGIDAKF